MTILGVPPQRRSEPVPAAPLPLPRTPGDVVARPSRVPELAHMSFGRLRAYRQSLLVEEARVSYWRRILQARRDLLRAGSPAGHHQAIAAVLTADRPRDGRRTIVTLHPQGGLPILPNLPDLWALLIDQDDEIAEAELFSRLGEAESILSSYRKTLHRRINRATAELVARYFDEPRLCLVALPVAT